MDSFKMQRIIDINRKKRFYNYLEHNSMAKCVLMISDHQLVFVDSVIMVPNHRFSFVDSVICDHWELSNLLLEAIGIDPSDVEKLEAIFISAKSRELTIDLPKRISLTQIALMNSVLNDISEFEEYLRKIYNDDDEMVEFRKAHLTFLEDDLNEDNLKAEMVKRLCLDKGAPEEVIIGKTPTEAEMEKISQEIQELTEAPKKL